VERGGAEARGERRGAVVEPERRDGRRRRRFAVEPHAAEAPVLLGRDGRKRHEARGRGVARDAVGGADDAHREEPEEGEGQRDDERRRPPLQQEHDGERRDTQRHERRRRLAQRLR